MNYWRRRQFTGRISSTLPSGSCCSSLAVGPLPPTQLCCAQFAVCCIHISTSIDERRCALQATALE